MNKLVGISAVVATVAVAAVGVAAPASAKTVPFGAKLAADVQPSNSPPGVVLNGSGTAVMGEAYGRPNGGELAPKSGVLKKVQITSGDFFNGKIQVVKVKSDGTAKVRSETSLVQVYGQQQQNWDDDSYFINTFKGLNLKIKKGDRLAISANTHMPAARCSSGGDNTLLYEPTLSADKQFHSQTNTDGCWILIQGFIK